MNILITSAGQRVSLVKAFKKELLKFNSEGKVFTTDLDPILAPACHISDEYFFVPKVTDKEYINEILNICINKNIKLIIPTIDTELLVLSENANLFKTNGIKVVISEYYFIKLCRDKRLTNQFFKDKGIKIPKQFEKGGFEYPVFVKPYDGSLSKGIFIANSPLDIKKEHLSNSKLMFMEYICPNDYDEFTVDCYYDKNSILRCVVPRKRIFIRAGEVSKAVALKNKIVIEFQDKLNYIRGVIGCITIQVFYHKENSSILGIEINPRFGGGYPLSYLAGANYPKWLIEEYLLNQDIEFFDNWENNLLMLRYDAEVLVHEYQK